MHKITDFTINDFLEKEDEYLSMMGKIEQRTMEIAKELGKIDNTWHIKDTEIYEAHCKFHVRAFFVRNGYQEMMTFPTDWLFSDNYKDLLKQAATQEQIKNNKEYLEYLRLKEKFEPQYAG